MSKLFRYSCVAVLALAFSVAGASAADSKAPAAKDKDKDTADCCAGSKPGASCCSSKAAGKWTVTKVLKSPKAMELAGL